MKRLFKILAALLLLPALAQAKDYTVKVGEFSRLKVTDNITVVYRCCPDSAGIARFSCPDDLAPALLFDNPKQQTLKVQVSFDYIDRIDELPMVYVYSEFLSGVESSSDKTVEVFSPVRCPEFKGKLVGNGKLCVYNADCQRLKLSLVTGNGLIVATGRATDVNADLTGTGCIDVNGVEAANVYCHVLGTGSIHCHPQELLKLKGLGSTTVYYTGSPQIKKQGLGKLVHVGD